MTEPLGKPAKTIMHTGYCAPVETKNANKNKASVPQSWK